MPKHILKGRYIYNAQHKFATACSNHSITACFKHHQGASGQLQWLKYPYFWTWLLPVFCLISSVLLKKIVESLSTTNSSIVANSADEERLRLKVISNCWIGQVTVCDVSMLCMDLLKKTAFTEHALVFAEWWTDCVRLQLMNMNMSVVSYKSYDAQASLSSLKGKKKCCIHLNHSLFWCGQHAKRQKSNKPKMLQDHQVHADLAKCWYANGGLFNCDFYICYADYQFLPSVRWMGPFCFSDNLCHSWDYKTPFSSKCLLF